MMRVSGGHVMNDTGVASAFHRRIGRLTLALTAATIVLVASFVGVARADTLDAVLKRQKIVCGVSQGLPGFSMVDAGGAWKGFDVDFCRALSAAIFGSADRVDYVPLSADERFEALKAGKIDVLSRNSTWTMSRELGLGLAFTGILYYDGQSFMAPAERGWVSAMEIAGAKVCVQSGTTTEVNARAFFAQSKATVEILTVATFAQMIEAYENGKCDAITADRSALAAQRMGLKQPNAHTLLPEVISKEPLGPVVRKDDGAWAGIVRWVLFALVNAEEAGHSRATPPDAAAAEAIPPLSDRLPRDWYRKVVGEVGNYGDVFERNLGRETPLGIERGVNALWTQGGILYAPPLR